MRVPKRGPGRPAIIVSNHLGFIDILTIIISPLTPGFTPKKDLEEAPFTGKLCGGLQSLFLDRGGSLEERNKVVQQIIDRQEEIEVQQRSWQPFCIFAEGTVTNGECLLPFKRGAFAGMRTVQPVFCKLSNSAVHLRTDTFDIPVLVVLLVCEIGLRRSTLHIMPPFTPNDKMLEIHSDKGTEDWQIFAWCVRDAMAKAGNFVKREHT